jgi:hypothetical protein
MGAVPLVWRFQMSRGLFGKKQQGICEVWFDSGQWI